MMKSTIASLVCASILFAYSAIAADSAGEPGRGSKKANPLQKDPVVIVVKINDPARMDFALRALAEAFMGGVQYEPFNNPKILRSNWE